MMLLAAARDLMVVFLGIELMSIAVYVLAGLNRRSARVGRGRAQVLPARRVLHGVPALRHRARVRRDRLDEPHGDRPARDAALALARSPLLLVGIALLLDRVRLQGGRGAVPHVGARRLRGRADADHRVHGRDGQGRGVRRASCACGSRRSRRRRARGTSVCVARHRHDDRRQRDRARRRRNLKRMLAYSSIAHAGLPARRAWSSATRQGGSRVSVLPRSPTRWRRSARSRSSIALGEPGERNRR